jgi:glycosyltransferase involved in cell wall biosynthesis
MRVLMLSKACIVGIYQRKLEHIAAAGVDLLAVVPPSWKDERGETHLERAYTDGYKLHVTPIWLNGNFHFHVYPALRGIIRSFQPDLIHIDEEPYNLATWHALALARAAHIPTLFFSWQNLVRHYPPPFRWGEAWTLRTVDYALMGTESAADVWRTKGYQGDYAVVPQFGTDPDLFHPATPHPDRPFTVGYIGRLVPEKGITDLLRALAALGGEWQLRIVGSGPQRAAIERLAGELGVADCVTFVGAVPSTQMPAQYHNVDVLALPSRTRPNWKEQFGRVLVEAMASGVPVVGSDSGAIPGVIGDGGLVVREGDVNALTDALGRLREDDSLRTRLGKAGRARVLAHFTHEQVAMQTVHAYETVMRRANTS